MHYILSININQTPKNAAAAGEYRQEGCHLRNSSRGQDLF
jgi:hypothetical protein